MQIDEKDPRWAHIYDESESPAEVIRQFAKYFEIPTTPRSTVRPARRTQAQRWTEAIEKAKGQMAADPDQAWIYQENIADLEKKLAYAIKNNL